MLGQILPADRAAIKITVHDGIVTLTVVGGLAVRPDLLGLAARLTWDIDDVAESSAARRQGRPTQNHTADSPPPQCTRGRLRIS
jgi:hypothetical protein